jgi:hypothetical protein
VTLETTMQAVPVPRGRRVTVVKSVSATLLLMAAALGVWWDTSDGLLSGYGSSVSGPTQVGHTTYVGLFIGATSHRPTIDISRLHLRVATNTAEADISVRRCVSRPSGGGIGAVQDGWAQYCTSMDRFTSGAISLDQRRAQLVLAVTPRRAGVVDVQGVDLSYRHQLRFGRQHVGQRVTLTAPG